VSSQRKMLFPKVSACRCREPRRTLNVAFPMFTPTEILFQPVFSRCFMLGVYVFLEGSLLTRKAVFRCVGEVFCASSPPGFGASFFCYVFFSSPVSYSWCPNSDRRCMSFPSCLHFFFFSAMIARFSPPNMLIPTSIRKLSLGEIYSGYSHLPQHAGLFPPEGFSSLSQGPPPSHKSSKMRPRILWICFQKVSHIRISIGMVISDFFCGQPFSTLTQLLSEGLRSPPFCRIRVFVLSPWRPLFFCFFPPDNIGSLIMNLPSSDYVGSAFWIEICCCFSLYICPFDLRCLSRIPFERS